MRRTDGSGRCERLLAQARPRRAAVIADWGPIAAAAFVLIAAVAPAAAQTQPPDDESLKVETEVTVFGDAEPAKTDVSADARSLPASVTVLQDVAIRRKTFREPGELLRALPGVDFAYYGQGGIPSGPSVRGYTDRNFGQDMAGHLDGIPLNAFGFVASHGALDLTPLFPETFDRIELVRGPLDPRYGDFNRGASINFITKDSVERPSLALGISAYNTWQLTGTYGNQVSAPRAVRYYASVDGYNIDGHSDNQAIQHFKTFAKVIVPAGRGDLAFAALTFVSEWDAPSYLDIAQVKSGEIADTAAVNPTDGGDQNMQLAYVQYRLNPGTPGQLTSTFYVGHSEWRRFRSDFLISPTQTQTRQIDRRVKFGYRVEKGFGGSLLGRPSLLVIGSNLQHDDADTRQASTLNREILRITDDVPVILTSFGAYAQEQWQIVPRLKLMGGLRFSNVDYEIDDLVRAPGTWVESYSASQVSPKVGVAFSPVRDTELYVNVATGMRSPTPRTEVRNSLDSVDRIGIAETTSYEGGARALLMRRLDLRGSIWRADNTNEIRGIPPGGTQFESLGKSRRDGGELDVSWYAGPGTRIFTALSWVEAKLLTPTSPAANRLPDVPAYVHQIGVETGIPLGGAAPGALVVGVDLGFYGEKDLNTLGTIKSETYQRLNFRGVYDHRNRYRLSIGGYAYPGSRLGESAFLFGSTVGVRPNPRASVDASLTYLF